jgi:RNA polymerase sigma factor (sigma-70 family)
MLILALINTYKLENLVTEQEILQKLIINDTEVAKLLYKQHYPLIHTLVINNNGDIDEAKDVFQEAMIVLYEKAKNPEFDLQCKISTYLYSVARRIWLKKLQNKAAKYTINDNIEETVAVEDDMEHHENQNKQFELMHDALAKIGEPCKSLLEAYYFGKQHMNDIAAQFGYTNADNAKNQKYKCLIRLKKLFFAQHKNL